jgi:hypothetical protein
MGALELPHRIPRIVHDLKRKSLPALFLRESKFVKQGGADLGAPGRVVDGHVSYGATASV